MEQSNFMSLRSGDRVQIGTIKYTVLQSGIEYHAPDLMLAGETMVYLTPDDDNYVRKIGHMDWEIPFMRRLREGE